MRPKLQDVIERAWNEIANLPDGEQPKIHDNQLALELARYYEQDGHTAQQREDTLKADTWTLLCAYSFALREMPRYWKPEPIRTKKAYHYMALCMRSILDELIYLAFNMGLRLPQDTLKEYERHELWVQDFKLFVAQLYGEISGDEASTLTTRQPSPKDGAESQQPTKPINEDDLKKCFIIPFTNEQSKEYGFDHLLTDLNSARNPESDKIQLATIALAIWDGGYLTPTAHGNTFRKWYKKLCNIVGCTPSSYQPKDIKRIDKKYLDHYPYLDRKPKQKLNFH